MLVRRVLRYECLNHMEKADARYKTTLPRHVICRSFLLQDLRKGIVWDDTRALTVPRNAATASTESSAETNPMSGGNISSA